MSIYDELKWRGLLYDATEGVEGYLAENRITLYIGFDPTAASGHVGTLLQIMSLARMQRAGHAPISPVPPPTRAIGAWPARCMRARLMICSSVPTWPLAAVGSKPM